MVFSPLLQADQPTDNRAFSVYMDDLFLKILKRLMTGSNKLSLLNKLIKCMYEACKKLSIHMKGSECEINASSGQII